MTPQRKTAEQRAKRTLRVSYGRATLTRAQIQSDPAKTLRVPHDTLTGKQTQSVQALRSLQTGPGRYWDSMMLPLPRHQNLHQANRGPLDEDKAFVLRLWVPTLQAHNSADGDVLPASTVANGRGR